MSRVLVIGRSGQLALALADRAATAGGTQLAFFGRPDFDLETPGPITDLIRAHHPQAIVNAAAYTAVDKAESEADRAFAINCAGAAAAALAAAELDIPFIHVSTDYVFDGRKASAYREEDETGPLGVYGRSKLAGEEAVLAAHPGALVLRTSWVYSPFGNNFLKTMLRVGAERPLLRVVDDQIGNPTSALDLADAIFATLPRLGSGPGGVYHVAGEGSTSWHGFASFIFAESRKRGGPNPVLEAISTAEYPTAATRPKNSRLDCTAFAERFGIRLRPWQDATAETVARCLAGQGAGR